MKTIGIYNNKGGVGKSTVTLFLADFFSSINIANQKVRVLVMDFDFQGSSAVSLIGLETVTKARYEKRCVSHLLLNIKQKKQALLDDYLNIREKGYTATKKIPLGKLWVMATERDSTIEFENSCNPVHCRQYANFLKKFLANRFDIVLIDLPANIDERNKLSLIGLLLSDHILIPTEPSRISINALADTFNTMQYIRGVMSKEKNIANILGILLNKTDRRSKQYKLHHKELSEIAANHNTMVFNNFLPTAPTLSSASDDSLEFATLKEKYDKYYDNVRKVAIELAEKCGYKIKRKRK